MKILTAPVIDYDALKNELFNAGILDYNDTKYNDTYILYLFFSDYWSYDCYLKLPLNDKFIPLSCDSNAPSHLRKRVEILSYLRKQVPGYDFILIKT